MIDIDSTFFIQHINFLLTVVFLNALLIRPIREKIKDRNTLMSDQLSTIEDFTANADEKLKGYELALDSARQQGLELRKQMRAEGSGEEQQIMSAVGKEVAATLKAAQDEIAAQVSKAKAALVSDVEKFALKATAKILGQA